MRFPIGRKRATLTTNGNVHNFRPVTPITLRIRALRERRGWSQAELARRSGVNQGTISRVERGETRTLALHNLERLAKALGVSPRSLIVHTKR
ncbi:MAG: helix-turn-helix domain-containing protein [Anaerolineales bacterium]